jgi:putative oxidoreductase
MAKTDDPMQWGALALRVSLGVMFITHSVYLKAMVFTLPGTAKFFESIGLPAFLAYVVFTMEAIGGVLLDLGVRTRVVAAALVPVLIGATWAHAGNGWLFTNPNGGWEYPLFLTIACVVQAFLGSGALAVSGSRSEAIAHTRSRQLAH